MNRKMDLTGAPAQRQPRVVALWPGDDTQPDRPGMIFVAEMCEDGCVPQDDVKN